MNERRAIYFKETGTISKEGAFQIVRNLTFYFKLIIKLLHSDISQMIQKYKQITFG